MALNLIDTNFKVSYEMIDTTADKDAIMSQAHSQSFSTVQNIVNGLEMEKYISTEKNFTVLDGSCVEYDNSEIAYYSSGRSNDGGVFTTPPTITATFTENHSSIGLTIYFADMHPLECEVEWYDLSGNALAKHTFEITSSEQQLRYPVEDYGKIVISFTKALPNHDVKISHLVFGIVAQYDETRIQSGKLTEGLDRISNQLSINKLSFSIVDLAEDFNLGNSEGIHPYVQFGQVVQPIEEVRGVEVDLGKYFISTFSASNSLIKFDNVDYIGLLDKIQFYKGDLWSGKKAGEVIDLIMSTAQIEDYSIEEDVYNTLVYGTIVPMTCRKALREVCFAVGAVVNTSRTDKIEIYFPSWKITNNIPKSVKISTKATRRDYISGVTIKHTDYMIKEDGSPDGSAETHVEDGSLVIADSGSNSSSKIVNGSYVAGDNLITWNTPRADIETTAGTLTEVGKYYCILHLDEDSDVQINGVPYKSQSVSTTVRVDKLEGGKSENIKNFTCNLVNNDTARKVANSIMKYYGYRLQLDLQYLADAENILDWSIVENQEKLYNDYVAGYESISTDLTGGFVATAKMIGYYNTPTNDLYMRTTNPELYANDEGLI